MQRKMGNFKYSQNVSGNFRCVDCSFLDHQVMVKSFLAVPREKLLKKLQCSNRSGNPGRVSVVASSMEVGKVGERMTLPLSVGGNK